MEKYSFLGLSLLTVSAITAAFAPSNTSSSSAAINGIIAASTDGAQNGDVMTCRERVAGDSEANCSFTNTGPGALSSTDMGPGSNSISIISNTLSLTTKVGID